MKITLKQGLVITLIFGLVVIGFSLVGNNQRVNADGSVTRLSISEITELFSLFSSDKSDFVVEGDGDIDEYVLGGVTNYDSLTLGENLIVGGNTTFSGTLDVTGATTVEGAFSAGGGLIYYGPVAFATTSIMNAATLTQAELLAAQYWTVSINDADDLTYTLPATSTLTSLLTNTGEHATWCFHNATTSAHNLIFAAGTGIDLESATSTLNIYPDTVGCITLRRNANDVGGNTDVTATFRNWVDMD